MTDHEQQWFDRYGADYPNPAERAAAYRLHQVRLQEMRAIFADTDAPPTRQHVNSSTC